MELDHNEDQPLELSYDLEWLTILHLTNHLLSVKKGLTYMPGPSGAERYDHSLSGIFKQTLQIRSVSN